MAQLAVTAAASLASGLGRTIASTAASFAAGLAERVIFGPKKRKVIGPQLESFQVQASTEGAAVLRVFGRARVSGQVIWAANFRETVSTTSETAGKGARLGTKTKTTEYLYSISLAIGLSDGVIDRIGRIWADGKPFDASAHNMRIYRGTEDQLPDAAIEAIEGAGKAPAFRGLAYVVFEDLALKEFGNRIPQFSFEIEKSLRETDRDSLENALSAVALIPGSGEFVLGTTKVFREIGEGRTTAENAHNNDGVTDFSAALDGLLAAAPNVKSVALVVSWFGTDLRAGTCLLKPGVEIADKTTSPYEWRAGGVARAGAHVVSTISGAPAYGGTPADQCVLEAIAALKARGLKVTLHPFILMDIPPTNGLPDPGGSGSQPAYPWRGRISVGAADKTAAAAAAIQHFFGSAAPHHFGAANGLPSYAGPNEWSFRRMILHYAKLASLAGGVDRFLIGSELRGVTTARSGAAAYPAVPALQALAADVRALLPTAKISYAADWTEYFGHQPADGSGDVFFHLDPFWSDANVDFVGVDNYAPLADWRDGFAHQDAAAGYEGPHERDYLQANIEGGERYAFYYAGAAARADQTRTPITDGQYGEPWIYRAKDFRNWWLNPHHDRPGGVRAPAPTSWVPQSKPIVFTEIGCPAVDKGANEPNLFVDPKSAESRLPHFSTGARDDLAQRRFIEASLSYWRDPAKNPTSPVYGATMIDAEDAFVYAFDARPFPFFPALKEVWGDAANWRLGHWLNGRLARAPLDLLVTALARDVGAEVDASGLKGAVGGYVLDRPLSPREAIEPLAEIFQFDMTQTPEALRFSMRDGGANVALQREDLAAREEGAVSTTLLQAADLPAALRIAFIDEAGDYGPALAEARAPGALHFREAGLEAPIVMSESEARARANAILADFSLSRARIAFDLPPSMVALEPGDVVFLDGARWRIAEISDGAERRVEAVRIHPSVYEAPAADDEMKAPSLAGQFAPPVFEVMDLPLLGDETPGAALFAAMSDPWPGGVALYRDGPSGDEFAGVATAQASLGRLEAPLAPRGSGRFIDQTLRVRMAFGQFSSRSAAEVLAGANALGLETAGGFEALQFKDAELGTDGIWTLRGLLRGQKGTEDLARLGAPAGARVVVLNAALAEADYPIEARGSAILFRAGPERERPEHPAFAARTATLSARNLKPLSPVHLRAEKIAGGRRLSFLRRSRGAENFDIDPPLAEAQERYRIRIFASSAATAPTRVIEVSGPFSAGDPYLRPHVLYTDAMILADFGAGSIPAGAEFEVVQLSDAVGEGMTARAAL